jgi:hypothetical protein
VIDSINTLEKHARKFSRKDRFVFLGQRNNRKRLRARRNLPGAVLPQDKIGQALKKVFFLPTVLGHKGRKIFRRLAGLPVNSTHEITSDDAIALAFQKQNGSCLENLDAYGSAPV